MRFSVYVLETKKGLSETIYLSCFFKKIVQHLFKYIDRERHAMLSKYNSNKRTNCRHFSFITQFISFTSCVNYFQLFILQISYFHYLFYTLLVVPSAHETNTRARLSIIFFAILFFIS